MGGVKSDRLSNLIQDCDIRRKNQYSLFRMIRNITCQQVRLSCSGRLYNAPMRCCPNPFMTALYAASLWG